MEKNQTLKTIVYTKKSGLETYVGRYRFSFNGKENDNEVSGSGNSYDYGFRIYNPRLGRFLSVDPLSKSYPWYTPYQFAGNKPIWAIDLDGLEEYFTSSGELIGKYGTSTEIRVVFDEYISAARDVIFNQNVAHGNGMMNNILYNKGSAGSFSGPDAAAADWGIRYNKTSIDNNKEMASFIFVTKINGKSAVSYTNPSEGTEASSTATFKPTITSRPLAIIHSHGKYLDKYDNNIFSDDYIDANGVFNEGDIGNDNRSGFIGYVTTSNGSLLKHSPYSQPETIRCDMPSDPKDPTTSPSQVVADQELKTN